MDKREYAQLKAIARRKKVSVGELVRTAVRERYLTGPHRRGSIVEGMFRLNLPVDDWEKMERDIIEARFDDVR